MADAKTVGVSTVKITSDPMFRRGMLSMLRDEKPDFDLDSWDHERGRLFVIACRTAGIKLPSTPRQAALLYNQFCDAGVFPRERG